MKIKQKIDKWGFPLSAWFDNLEKTMYKNYYIKKRSWFANSDCPEGDAHKRLHRELYKK